MCPTDTCLKIGSYARWQALEPQFANHIYLCVHTIIYEKRCRAHIYRDNLSDKSWAQCTKVAGGIFLKAICQSAASSLTCAAALRSSQILTTFMELAGNKQVLECCSTPARCNELLNLHVNCTSTGSQHSQAGALPSPRRLPGTGCCCLAQAVQCMWTQAPVKLALVHLRAWQLPAPLRP